MEYLDYDTESFEINNVNLPYIHKRKSFEYENELRAIVVEYPSELKPEFFDQINKRGINVEVNLDILIEKIYIAPTSPGWFRELVKSITIKYGIDKPIVDSKLDERPAFK